MNPYAILGVSVHATDLEIKRAYRDLVKRYHPDRPSPESSHEQIVAINYAYDILSDPEKRAQYDRGFASIYIVPEQHEDPREVYKREYKRKRWEREKKERDERLAQRKTFYTVLRWFHFAVLVFGIGLIINDCFIDHRWNLWHVVMTLNAIYICYRREISSLALALAQWNLFVLVVTLIAMIE